MLTSQRTTLLEPAFYQRGEPDVDEPADFSEAKIQCGEVAEWSKAAVC